LLTLNRTDQAEKTTYWFIRHWRIYKGMQFIETSIFTRLVTELLTDDEYRLFPLVLAEYPERDDLIQGSHGLRKIRIAAKPNFAIIFDVAMCHTWCFADLPCAY